MISLWRAELLRFFSRRLLRWLSLLAVAAGALGGLISFLNTEADAGAFGGSANRADLTFVVIGASMWLIFGAWVIGASFVGAEWQKGTMTTTLTWEARRGRVMAAKFLAAATGTILWHVGLVAVLLVLLAPTYWLHGAGSVEVGSMAFALARGAGLAAFAAAAAGGVAMIGRTTAAAVGAGFAWFAVVEGFGRALRPNWAPWYLGDNAGGFLVWETLPWGRGPAAAGGVVILYLVAIVAASWLFFSRRDAA